jgi:dihydroorotate dehydrogenase electron transfer subunit
MHETKECHITGIYDEGPNVKTFMFSPRFEEAKPGQFAMVGLENGGEKPFSFSGKNSITVKKIAGKPEIKTFTERMSELKEKDSLIIRGPLGKGFEVYHSDYLSIGGGFGLTSPRFQLMEYGNGDTRTFAGGKTAADIIFRKDFGEFSKLHIATEDGSTGYHGTVVDLLKETAEKQPEELKASKYLICGPEKMMAAAAEFLESIGVDAEDIKCSIERYMKCGMGLCGGCSCGGYRVCVDGPVFPYSVLKESKHFGKSKRAKSGRLVDI